MRIDWAVATPLRLMACSVMRCLLLADGGRKGLLVKGQVCAALLPEASCKILVLFPLGSPQAWRWRFTWKF